MNAGELERNIGIKYEYECRGIRMMSISSPRIKVLHQYQVRILYNNLERDVSIKYEWCYVCTYVM